MPNQKASLSQRLKSKGLLWYAGVLVTLLSISGISYGVWVCYNGFILRGTTNQAILKLLEDNTMSIDDGVYAFIGFGSVIIIYYLLTLIVGVIGILSSNMIMVKQTLFWIDITLISISLIFGIVGLFSWRLVGINLVILGAFAIIVFRKYNIDLSSVKKRKKRKRAD